ncbi:hypothetical protein BC629DRAFT_1725031 [Irpex lacteus]|nr:hypothetical protein BC629DRAFT_1725031 [Irpex lacteus]
MTAHMSHLVTKILPPFGPGLARLIWARLGGLAGLEPGHAHHYVLVILVTWISTARVYIRARNSEVKAPLASLLLRDGTVWFIVFLVINAINVVEVNVSEPVQVALGNVQPFFEVLLPLIVCRFILHLRQPKLAGTAAGSSWASGNQSFSVRFVGNAGNALQIGEEDEEEYFTPQNVGDVDSGMSSNYSQGSPTGSTVERELEHGNKQLVRPDYCAEVWVAHEHIMP